MQLSAFGRGSVLPAVSCVPDRLRHERTAPPQREPVCGSLLEWLLIPAVAGSRVSPSSRSQATRG